MKKTGRTLSVLLALVLIFAMGSGMAYALEIVDIGTVGVAPAAPSAPSAPAAPTAPNPAPAVQASTPGNAAAVGKCSHLQWNTPTYSEQADGSYLAVRTCANCGAVQKSVGTIKEEVLKKATCTESGLKVYYAVFKDDWAGKFKVHEEAVPALGHDVDTSKFVWVGDENYHYNVCSRCGERSNPQPHQWGEWQVLKQATSQNPGKAIQYCTVCGCNRTWEIPRRTPQTGDDAMLGLWTALAIVSAVGAVSLIAAKKKNSK